MAADKVAGPRMRLCPNCKSIQKANTPCTICKFPVPDVEPESPAPTQPSDNEADTTKLADIQLVFYPQKDDQLKSFLENNKRYIAKINGALDLDHAFVPFRSSTCRFMLIAPNKSEGTLATISSCVAAALVDIPKNSYELLLVKHADDPLPGQAQGKLDPDTRKKINMALIAAGLDGNGRFEKAGRGLAQAMTVLSEFNIELDDVPSLLGDSGETHYFMAFSNKEDLFSPVPIDNSLLVFQWYTHEQMPSGRPNVECLAYVS